MVSGGVKVRNVILLLTYCNTAGVRKESTDCLAAWHAIKWHVFISSAVEALDLVITYVKTFLGIFLATIVHLMFAKQQGVGAATFVNICSTL